ncbi:MAG: CDP-alcohol phosphatidyltransferase family protein [Myxococcota bacterium]
MTRDEADGPKRRRRRRRRTRSDPDRAGFASLLPQLLTTANLAAGFYAIIMASRGHVLIASYAIFVAAVFDILDGRAARMTGNVGTSGPVRLDRRHGLLRRRAGRARVPCRGLRLPALGGLGDGLHVPGPACAATGPLQRLLGSLRGRFDRLPSPAGAGMVVSAVWFKNFLVGPEVGLGLPPILPALGVAGLGLPDEPIPYHSFKNLRFRASYSSTVLPVIVSILLILEPG